MKIDYFLAPILGVLGLTLICWLISPVHFTFDGVEHTFIFKAKR